MTCMAAAGFAPEMGSPSINSHYCLFTVRRDGEKQENVNFLLMDFVRRKNF